MRLRLLLPALSLIGVSVAFGSAPIARVISSEPVEVNGINAPARNFVPLGLGGEVTTRGTSALIQFSDGGSVLVQPNSQVKITGKAESPQVDVLRGAAQYKLSSGSHVHMASGNAHVAGRVAEDALAQAGMVSSPLGAFALASASRTGFAASAGIVPPSAPVGATGFEVAPISIGTFVSNAGPGGTGLSIFTPGGLVINLTPTTNPNTGVVTYTVASITQEVTLPNGTTSTVQVTTGNLIGATIGGITPSTTSGTEVAVTITPAGQTTPLTPSQASQSVQTSVNTAVNTAVQNGTLPAGTTAPAPSPVSTGTFSSTAP